MKHYCLWIIRVSILLTVSTMCWAQGTWRAFTTADGLVGNSILGIMEDKDRNLWIQTNDGLSRYDGQLQTILEERLDIRRIQSPGGSPFIVSFMVVPPN